MLLRTIILPLLMTATASATPSKPQDTLKIKFQCSLALSNMFTSVNSPSYRRKIMRSMPKRMDVCLKVGLRAKEFGLPTAEVISIGYYESKFTESVVSSAGAMGPLQVIPRYFCPNGRAKGCDLIAAGLKAIRKFKNSYGDKYLCHYNSGIKCYRRSKRYARKVSSLRKVLEGYTAYVFREGFLGTNKIMERNK